MAYTYEKPARNYQTAASQGNVYGWRWQDGGDEGTPGYYLGWGPPDDVVPEEALAELPGTGSFKYSAQPIATPAPDAAAVQDYQAKQGGYQGAVEQQQQNYDAARGISTTGGPLRRALPVGPVQVVEPGSTRPSPGSDPYGAFKHLFEQQIGRPISQAEMNSNEFLQGLSNELLRALPVDRLRGFSLDRLGLLPNEDIQSLVPDLIPQMSNERVGTMSKGYLAKVITDPTRRRELGLPEVLAASGSPTDGKAVAADTGPRTGQDTSDNRMPIRPLHEIIGGQGVGGIPGMNDLEAQKYFDFNSDPAGAGRNIARAFGLDPNAGNPFTEMLPSFIAPLARTSLMQLQADSSTAPSTTDQATAVARALSGGSLNPFKGQAGPDFLNKMLGIQDRYMNGGQLSAGQLGLAEQLKDPKEAFDAFLDVQGGGLSPVFRGHPGVRQGVYNTLYDRWRNSAGMNTPFLRALMGAA